MKKNEKTILLPDFHHPYHSVACWGAIKKFMRWFQPDRVVILGDGLEMRAIDHWKKSHGNLRYFEGKRLLVDYNNFIKDILEPIEKICPKAKKIYLGGNHEEWATLLISQQPVLEGMIEPEVAMNLKERGWDWIPYKKVDKEGNVKQGLLKLGKLTLTHGVYLNKFHASRTADTFRKSTVYGHTHTVQSYTKVHVEDPSDYHTSQSIGCLCNKSPMFLGGRPNRWVHAFGVVYTRPTGHYNLYVPIIIKGSFTFADKNFNS